MPALTAGTIVLAGLIDGFNPCAFSIVIFLAGILAVGGRQRRARVLGGWSFCFASFATYMLMGFGLLSAIRALEGFGLVRDILFAALAVSLFVLAALSFRDAARYNKARVPQVITLQLPDKVKKAIRSFAEMSWSGPAVVGTGLVCGFVVTLLDSLCTGQIYVPVLALLAKESHSLRAVLLLALYNLAFIAPLIAIFLLAAYGADSERMSKWSKRNVVPSKIFLGIMFAVLGYLVWPEFENASLMRYILPSTKKSVDASTEETKLIPVFKEVIEAAAKLPRTGTTQYSAEDLLEKNEWLDAQIRKEKIADDFLKEILPVVLDRREDIQWRNYCLQVLPECWMKLPSDSAYRLMCEEEIRFALSERDTILPGTALLGLSRLAEHSERLADRLESAVLMIAADSTTPVPNRIAALSIAAERGISAALSAARMWKREGESDRLKLVAADAVRILNNKE